LFAVKDGGRQKKRRDGNNVERDNGNHKICFVEYGYSSSYIER
jgi:hypothetical protein